MNIGQYLLERAIAWLTSGKLLELAKALVLGVNNEDISNTEKHAKVIAELKAFGADFGTTLLDILVKVAVLWMQSKQEVK